MTAADRSLGVTRLAAALEHDDDLVEDSVREILASLSSYETVGRPALEASIRRNIDLATRTLLTSAVPTGSIWQADMAISERLEIGGPLEDMMAAHRISMAHIQDRMVELARRHGVPGEAIVDLTGLLWRLSDSFSAQGARAYQAHTLERAVARQRRRDEWLLALLRNDLSTARLAAGMREHRLPDDASYRAVCIVRPGPKLETGTRRVLGRAAEGAMLVSHHDDLVGVVRSLPTDDTGDVLVAVGPATSLPLVHQSYAVAVHVRDAALRPGTHTVETLGWRIGVPQVAELAVLLRTRYLDPVESLGAFGSDLLADLAVYLARDRSIPRAAEALHVHVNTLRYRLSRFEQVTGRSLQDTDTLVELAWSLRLAGIADR